MKITKNGLTRDVSLGQMQSYIDAGWQAVTKQAKVAQEIKVLDEQVSLKPPVKSKGTDNKTLDNANQGE